MLETARPVGRLRRLLVLPEMVPHIKTAISSACQAIIRSEVELNELDTQCGDGDCGATLKGGAEGRNDCSSQIGQTG